MATAELKVRIEAEIDRLKKGLNEADRDLKGFGNSATNSANKFASSTTSAFKVAGAAIAGAFTAQSLIGFTQQVFEATAQFQKFGAVLTNTLGSSALANLQLKEIQDFAAKTPFGVNELTNSFVKLANQGFKPTGDQMRSLGDLAASTGKSFDQLSEAILDAQTGEFERLKEFGIRAQASGDQVIFTFKGIQTTVDKSSESIRNYITSLGNAEGVSGSMAAISETLGGKISNLQDSWDQLLISVGNNTQGVFSSAISIISKAIESITGFNKSLELANKFGLKQDFGLNFQQGSLKLSDVKGQVSQVENAQKSVQKYVKSIQEISKTPEEFKSAMQSLANIANEQLSKINDKNLAKAIAAQYKDGIEVLRGLSVEAAKVSPPKLVTKEEIERLEKLKDLQKQLKDQKLDNYLSGLDLKFRLATESADGFKNSLEKTKSETAKIITGGQPLVDINTLLGGGEFKPDNLGEQLYTPFQIFSDELQFDLLPKLGSSFNNFFDELLIRGEVSFKTLGESIKRTFASVLASEATQGILSLLGAKGSDGKRVGAGSLLTSVGGLLGIGKGGGEGVGKGIGGFLGKALPIAGAAFAGISLLSGLFKKRKTEPTPAFTTSNAIASQPTAVGFDTGRVVFEISGVNLVGVLNRAGAKLQRFGP